MKNISDIFPWTLSVPRSELFSEKGGGKTVSFEKTNRDYFSRQIETIVFIIFQIFFENWGLNITRIFSSFKYSVTRGV